MPALAAPIVPISHVLWSESELDAYLASPKTYIPGNRMSFPGYKDPVKRAAMIAYLKTLK